MSEISANVTTVVQTAEAQQPALSGFGRISHGERGQLGVLHGGLSVLQKRAENIVLLCAPLLGAIACPFWFWQHTFNWIEVAAFIVGYVVIGLGVGIGLHRYFAHRSFTLEPWLAWCLGAAGCMAFQGSVLRWVADHRRHHAYTDSCGDVHSPYVDARCADTSTLAGLVHAHIGWLFDSSVTDYRVFGKDLIRDPLVMSLHRTRWLWPVLSLLAPWLWGYTLAGMEHAWSCLLFAGCLRTTLFQHAICAVNSFGHTYGYQTYKLENGSRNNTIVAWATFGEGWHNNHHRFPRSAFHGFAMHEIDVGGMIIRTLERLGIVRDVIRAPVMPMDVKH